MFQVVHYVFDYKQICDFSCSSLFHVVALCATIGVVNGVVNCDDRNRCPAVLLPLRTTPSVAEQEGQLIETEATGAPQKHHHTLNQ